MTTRVIVQADPTVPYNSVMVQVMENAQQAIVMTELLEAGAVVTVDIHATQSILVTESRTSMIRRNEQPAKSN
jgi:hypothetical protein